MRLTNPNGAYIGENEGTNADVIDKLLPPPTSSKRPRGSSMPMSSLDFKAQNQNIEESLTTTIPSKRKSKEQMEAEEELQRQKEVHQQQQYFRKQNFVSRARGGSGPPPHRHDLKDLETMTEQQVMQALHSDPELAAQATKAAEEAQRQQRKRRNRSAPASSQNSKKSRDRFYRGADGIAADSTEYPEYLKQMMDQGVPVAQWAILLLLLVVSLWWLKKTLQGPQKPPKSKGREGVRLGKNKGKKSKNERIVKKVMNDIPDRLVKSLLVDDKLEEKRSKNRSSPPKKASYQKQSEPAKKTQSPKKNKKAKAANGSVKKVDKVAKPISVLAAGEDDKATSRSIANSPIQYEPNDDGGDWLPVTKQQKVFDVSEPKADKVKPVNGAKTSGLVASANEAPSPFADEDVEPTESSMPELIQDSLIPSNGASASSVSQATAVAIGAVATELPNPLEKSAFLASATTPAGPLSDGKDLKSFNNKKKKRKDTTETTEAAALPLTISSTASKSSGTDNDAVLARMLQQEEETLAKHAVVATIDAAAAEDVWEEVTNKRKKGIRHA